MKNNLALVFSVLFVIGLTLGGCDDSTESSDDGAVGGEGILTLNNGPYVTSVVVYNYNGTPTTSTELGYAMFGSAIAMSIDANSPHALFAHPSYSTTFTGTGTFFVVVNSNSAIHFKGEVSFNNGSATIDFNTMSRTTDLMPY
jgi:hypothetical protein